jgi:transposase
VAKNKKPRGASAKKGKQDKFENYLTYKFKVRDRFAFLLGLAAKVNYVWNYCNETSLNAIRKDSKFLSWVELNNLTSGTSKILNLHSQTVQAVCETYAKSRKQAGKRRLNWRKSLGCKRSLGWVPFKASGISVDNKAETVTFGGKKIGFFGHRPIVGKIKSGCFVEDSCGDWWVCFVCDQGDAFLQKAPVAYVGVDLGKKDLATTSDGQKFGNLKAFAAGEAGLAMAQRAGKKRQAARRHRKIARVRQDAMHKIAYALATTYQNIFVGNLSLGASKSNNDAAFRGLAALLEVKARRRQGVVERVNEAWTTVACSFCLERTGPRGVTGLSVREWVCGHCGQCHDRDVNAARNILRLGLEAPKIFGEPLAS